MRLTNSVCQSVCHALHLTPSAQHRQHKKEIPGNTKGGKYHCTIDLLYDWFGLVCFANKNKNCL
jgi:hypothetical protein